MRWCVLGLALAGCGVLPLEPSGLSIVDLLLAFVRRDPWMGLSLGLTLGLPYGFGLLVAAHGATRGTFGAWGLRAATSLLILEVFLLGLLLAVRGAGLAPWALAGVSGSALLARVGEALAARAASRTTPPAFFIRWGAVLVAATFGWIRLQFVGDPTMPGIAIMATCGCAALLAAASAPHSPAADPTA